LNKFQILKGPVSQRFFASGFFRESSYPKPMIIALDSFQIFPKIHGDICKSRFTTGDNYTGDQYQIFPGVNYTGSKFAAGVVDTMQ
jgi:hypothetical protein